MSSHQSPTHYVYFGRSLLNPDAIKIGVSQNPESRLRSLMAEPVAYIECVTREDAMALEKVIHESLSPRRIHGEWFQREMVAVTFGLFMAKHPHDEVRVVSKFYLDGEVDLGMA